MMISWQLIWREVYTKRFQMWLTSQNIAQHLFNISLKSMDQMTSVLTIDVASANDVILTYKWEKCTNRKNSNKDFLIRYYKLDWRRFQNENELQGIFSGKNILMNIQMYLRCPMFSRPMNGSWEITLRSGDTLTNDRLERWCYC